MADQETEYIVFGFARNVEYLLPDTNNPYFNVPTSIIYMIISYVSNYFENRGIYKWSISENKLVTKILAAKCGEKFESDEFMMSRLKWKLEIYPQGIDDSLTGYFVVGLRLLYTPSMIAKVEFGRIFRVFECEAGAGWSSSISMNEISKWSKKLPTAEVLKANVTSITIECEINIHRLILKQDSKFNIKTLALEQPDYKPILPENYHLVFSLNKNDSMSFKNSKCEKTMCSDVLNDLWVVQASPNGDGREYIGYVSMFLILFKLPIGVKTIKTKFKIICEDINKTYSLTHDFDMEHFGWGDAYFCTLQELKQFDIISFSVDIQVLQVLYQCEEQHINLEITDPLQITHLLTLP